MEHSVSHNAQLPMQVYIAIYVTLLLMALGLTLRHRRQLKFLTRDYFIFLCTPAKFAIYVFGTLALVLPVEPLGLSSWDYPVAFVQPAIAYLLAPWAVAAFCKASKGQASALEMYVAGCCMLFTGSWSVELYILVRDGAYMHDWLENLPIGIVCFLGVGLLWNVDWENRRNGRFWLE